MKKNLLGVVLMMFSINCFSGDYFTEEFTGKVVDLSTCWRTEGGYAMVKLKNDAGVERGAYWGIGDANASLDGMKRGMYSTLLSAYVTGGYINIMTSPLGSNTVPVCGVSHSYVLRGVRLVSN